MASPFANMAILFDVEWRVNGFWNSRFSHFFPPMFNTTGYFCCPESLAEIDQTHGGRGDLVIRRADHDAVANTWQVTRPLVVYEGKGDNNAMTDWEDIVGQARGWCDDNHVRDVWLVAAWGSRVRFYRYKSTGLYPVTYNGAVVVGGATRTYDVRVAADLAMIDAILQYAEANPNR